MLNVRSKRYTFNSQDFLLLLVLFLRMEAASNTGQRIVLHPTLICMDDALDVEVAEEGVGEGVVVTLL